MKNIEKENENFFQKICGIRNFALLCHSAAI